MNVGPDWAGVQVDVSRETLEKIREYADMLRRENERQNLIAGSTIPNIWDRHLLDSAQLVSSTTRNASPWLDVGSGAGLPGIVVALLTQTKHILVEPRRLRAEFLRRVVAALELGSRVQIVQTRVEQLRRKPVAIITARAFASLKSTFAAAFHLADQETTWLLHKGRTVRREIAEARADWSGSFEFVPSVTDRDAAIVKVSGLRRKMPS